MPEQPNFINKSGFKVVDFNPYKYIDPTAINNIITVGHADNKYLARVPQLLRKLIEINLD